MFDFPKSKAPELAPLKNSFVYDDVENELRNLFVDLFETYLSIDAFDANALGMAHLGTLNLVRRSVNADGLVLLPGDKEEPSTRYVYRAWKSRNVQGRGLYFLKTYLQGLFPGAWRVDQMMQAKASAYPTALFSREFYENDVTKFLTSRLRIVLDASQITYQNLLSLLPIISAIIPARFIPRFYLALFSDAKLVVASICIPTITLHLVANVLSPYSFDISERLNIVGLAIPSTTLNLVSIVTNPYQEIIASNNGVLGFINPSTTLNLVSNVVKPDPFGTNLVNLGNLSTTLNLVSNVTNNFPIGNSLMGYGNSSTTLNFISTVSR